MISVKDYFWCLLREQDDEDMDGFIQSYIGLMKNKHLAQIIYNIDNNNYGKVYYEFELGIDYVIDDEKRENWFIEKVRGLCYNRYLMNLDPYDYVEDDMGGKIPVNSNGDVMDIEGMRDLGSEDIILKGVFGCNGKEDGIKMKPVEMGDDRKSLSRSNSF